MSGHSKWSQIKRKKAVTDSKRGQLYTKLGREITVAAQQGGVDPNANFRLEQALTRARGANMPKDTIERAIQRGAGAGSTGEMLEELTYEAYGPGGVGLLIEVVTDNRNRSVADVRSTLTRIGGTFAEAGSVAWQFEARGEIEVAADSPAGEDIELLAIDLGAVDVEAVDGSVHIYTEPGSLERVKQALEAHAFVVRAAELTKLPTTPVQLDEADAERVLRIVETLEELDDVVRVHATLEISEALVAKLES
jgi:YebC/PmpR family DNA-binding regulatory protein